MGILAKVTSGRLEKPWLICIYGAGGVGKSTFASEFPSPIFLGPEEGTSNLDVSRLPIKTFAEAKLAVKELLTEEHTYKTLVIDSLDWLEPIVWKAVCDLDDSPSIDEAQGSYGKGYAMAVRYWRTFIDDLTELRETKGMNIVAIAHSQVKTFHDPSQVSAYDRYQLKLNDKAAALWKEYVDFLGFATYEILVTSNKNKKETRALGDGKRVLYTEFRPSFDAKNRFGLPFKLPLSFSELQKHIDSKKASNLEPLRAEIEHLIGFLTDPDLKTKVTGSINEAGNDVSKLTKILNRLREITKETK